MIMIMVVVVVWGGCGSECVIYPVELDGIYIYIRIYIFPVRIASMSGCYVP